jgi:outer membrane protein OmpA-like peptidoglycan-associated protein
MSAWAALAAFCLHAAHAQVLSSAQTTPGYEAGGTLAGQARALRPTLAAHLTNPAVMEADEAASALPMQVLFKPGSAHLTVTATHSLDHLGQALSSGPLAAERIRIEGHADSRGSPEANRDISERRAMAVAAYLEQNFSIDPGRVTCIGQGSASPARRTVVIARLTSG